MYIHPHFPFASLKGVLPSKMMPPRDHVDQPGRFLIVDLCLGLLLVNILGIRPSSSADILLEMATLIEIFYFILQLKALLSVVAVVSIEMIVLTLSRRIDEDFIGLGFHRYFSPIS